MNGKQLKSSILQWAIQGKLVPQNPNNEPASVLLDKIRAEKVRLIKEKKIKKDKDESIIYRSDDNSYYEKFIQTGEVKCIDNEIPFEVPEGWEWCRLSSIIYPPKYGTSSKSQSTGKMPVLRMGNIQDGEIIFQKLVYSNNEEDNVRYKLQKGDLLFNRTNSAELVGKTAIYRASKEAIYAGYIIMLRPIYINSDFLNYVLNSPYARSYCKEVKTIGVQQCNINADKISHLLIPVPPINEEQIIVDKILSLNPIVNKYSKSKDSLDELNCLIKSKLKKSILQEAIQGRLVSQIAEEGTSQKLLEQIKEEKKRLTKEGKLKKSTFSDSIIFKGDDNMYYEQIGKKYIDLTNEIPFDIPDSWEWIRFGQLVHMNIGKTPVRGESQYWSNGKYSWVSISDMSDYGYIKVTKEKISEFSKETLMRAISPIGTLLMSFKLTIGRTSILDIEAFHNEAIISIYPFVSKDYLLRNYLFYILPLISNLGDSKVAIKGDTLNSKSLHNLLIPLPPINEQKRIVERVKELYTHLRPQ